MTNDQLAAVLAEQARHVAAKRARRIRKPPAVPPSPLHRCFCQDPWLPYDHQLGDHADFDAEDGAR